MRTIHNELKRTFYCLSKLNWINADITCITKSVYYGEKSYCVEREFCMGIEFFITYELENKSVERRLTCFKHDIVCHAKRGLLGAQTLSEWTRTHTHVLFSCRRKKEGNDFAMSLFHMLLWPGHLVSISYFIRQTQEVMTFYIPERRTVELVGRQGM